MTLIRAIAFLLHFTLVPIALGRLITYKARTNFIADYLVGFFANLGFFYLLFTWVEWIQNWCTFIEPVRGGFTILLRLYAVVLIVLGVVWLVLERKNFKIFIPWLREKYLDCKNALIEDKFCIIYILLFAGLVLFMLYKAYAYEINEWSYDDYDYVVTSKDTISTDTLSYVNILNGTMPVVWEKRAVASWGTYVAMLAKVSGFEVTTVYHTILPVFLLLIAILNFLYITKFLFKKFDDQLIFLDILLVAYIFGLYSHYSPTFRMLGAIWQGKAVLTVIAVPFFVLYLINAYKDLETRKYVIPIVAISLGACSLTSLSMMFIPTVSIMVWILMCIYHKRVCGFAYLVASLVGPLYVGVFYLLIWMLQQDMQNVSEDKYFKFRSYTSWWERWFY